MLRFADRLKTLLINGHPFKAEYGGMPMLIYVNGFKHFLRLSTLPQGVRPGRVDIWNMIGNDAQGGNPRNSPNHGEETIEPQMYRVTHQVDSNLPLTSNQKFRFGLSKPGQTRPKQNF